MGEGQRHAERIRRLEFENEELRRATKTNSKRATIRRSVGRPSAISPRASKVA